MKKNIVLIILIFIITLVFNFLGIKICLFYNLFNIPCISCGMTRAVFLILSGDIYNSFKYNILPIPLFLFISIYMFFYFFVDSKKTLMFIEDNKCVIIFIVLIIMCIVWYININNPLLYELD